MTAAITSIYHRCLNSKWVWSRITRSHEVSEGNSWMHILRLRQGTAGPPFGHSCPTVLSNRNDLLKGYFCLHTFFLLTVFIFHWGPEKVSLTFVRLMLTRGEGSVMHFTSRFPAWHWGCEWGNTSLDVISLNLPLQQHLQISRKGNVLNARIVNVFHNSY